MVQGEYEKLVMLHQRQVPHVVQVVPQSLTRIYSDGVLLGMGFLMSDVGTPIVRDGVKAKIRCSLLNNLFLTLAELHKLGHYHGDVRVQNAVEVNGNVVWIDFALCHDDVVGSNFNNKKRDDVMMLIDSIFKKENTSSDDQLKELISNYVSDIADIVSHVAQIPQVW
jgi:tRNA A-37 threonylcarbamoyl transferase component Bud32